MDTKNINTDYENQKNKTKGKKNDKYHKNINVSAYLDFHETFFPSVNLTEFF